MTASVRRFTPGLLALAALACRPAPAAEPAPPPPVEEDPGPDVELARAQAAEAERLAAERAKKQARVSASAQRILHEVAAARGLAVKGEVRVELIDKPGVRAFILEVMHEEMTAEELATVGRVEAALGLIPVGSDGEQVILELLELGVLGIYDPDRKALLIGEYVDKFGLGMVVGHEGAHGLQDMHFDLEALNQTHRGHSDLDTAKTFLIEGDAQAAYLAWMTGSEGIGSIGDDILDQQADQVLMIRDGMGIPYPTFARMLQMPYTDGTRSVIHLARSKGWAAVDALYKDLPTTSEQMLHLDKLEQREAARPVSVDPSALLALLPDHEPAWEDELGEASLLAMLADVAYPAPARTAAAGWGGDRYIALERKNDPAAAPLVVGVVAWDSKTDAKQFEPLFRAYLEKHKPGDHILARKGDKLIYATHFGEPLGFTSPDADTAALTSSLTQAAWSSFDVGKQPRR